MTFEISEKEKKKFDTDGYIVFKNVISDQTIKKSIESYNRIRKKCESFDYLYYRRFKDIALNDIYGIEHIFHPDIFEEDIFLSLMESKVLEFSREILNDDEVFLSRNRLH